MKRSASEEDLELQSDHKQICLSGVISPSPTATATDSCTSIPRGTVPSSPPAAGIERHTVIPQDAVQPKDGIIEEVRVVNFMSFSNNRYRLKENVNFVMGLNGSGKSTILTAIMVGLGSRAGITSRGTALKSLIKNGKRVAEVSVRLRNRGADAYSHDVYGDSIIIKRRLTFEGASSYKICSADNQVVSSKKDDLDSILDYFGIQVDNPVVILNQTASKEFLLSNTPKDMYRFFMRATLLEQLLKEYKEAIDAKTVALNELTKKQQVLELMKDEVRKYQRAYDACSSIDKLRGKIIKLKEEMAWAYVCEKERMLESVTKELKAEEARRPKFIQKMEESQKKLDQKQEEHTRLEEELKRASEDATGLQPQLSQQKLKVEACRRTAKTTADDLRRAQNILRGASADRDHIQKRIDELRSAAKIDYTALQREREQKISKLEQQLQGWSAECRTMEVNIDLARNVITTHQQKKSDLEIEEQNLRHRLVDIGNKLQKLESSKSNELRRYGSWMPDLIRRIDDAHRRGRFHQKPRGPVGANIKLRDGRWAVAVEKCIGPMMLSTFCVNDFHDEKVFEEIANQACPRQNLPNTVASKFLDNVHNVPRNPNKFPTVFEVLEISDPVIANCLVDQRRIEFVLLSDDKEEARNTMLHRPPPKYGEMFTITGDQIYSWPCFRSYPCKAANAKYLSADTEQLIRKCHADRDNVNLTMRQKSEEISHNKDDIRKKMEELRKAERQLREVRQAVSNANIEMSELKNVDDPVPGDMRMLEDELEVVQGKVSELEEKVTATKNAMGDATSSLKTAEQKLNEVEDQMRSAAEKLNPFQENLAQVHTDLERAREDIRYYTKKMKEFEVKLGDIGHRRDTAEKAVSESSAKAVQIHAEKIKTRRTAENISSEIQQVEVQIDAERNRHGDPEELQQILNDRKQRCVELSDDLRTVSAFLNRLSDMLKVRTTWFEETRKHITTLLRTYFAKCVSVQTNLTGRLLISHDKEIVEPIIERRDDTSADAHRSTLRGLSGGERSFVMTCFILSLWHLIESPFCCLDEFDVFMDHVNRQQCLDVLLNVCTTHSKEACRQFVILSPLSLAQWNLSRSHVHILQLAEPRSKQQNLPDLPPGTQ